MSEPPAAAVHFEETPDAADTHPLLSLLVESAGDPSGVPALKYILDGDGEVEGAGPDTEGVVPTQGILVTHEPKQNQQVSTEVKTRKVRKTTPERIRARAARLYDEIHDLIDQYNVRKEREKFLSTGRRVEASPEATTSNPSKMKRTSSQVDRMAAGLPAQAPPQPAQKFVLPNLQQSFQEARLRHLERADEQRSDFPLQHCTEFSSKDPSAFSMRFQRTE